ncbi:lysophospholipid acyltransferase family protein [Chloroflexota bacterium]
MPWIYYVAKTMGTVLFLLLTRLHIEGRENIPAEGPVLIVANHLSNADPPLLGVSMRRYVKFMAKKELFRSKLTSYIMRGIGAFPVHRGQWDRKGLQEADKVLAKGLGLVIFPEGMRSKSKQLQPAFPGSALIASRYKVPILPIGITGTEKINGIGWILCRPKITINIGQLFYLPPAKSRLNKTEMIEFSHFIMEHISKLLPLEYRGNYAR